MKTVHTITKKLRNWTRGIIARLTRPAPTLETSEARRQANLLSILLLSTIIFGLIAEIVTMFLFRHTEYTGYYVTFSFLLLMAGLYGMSRTQHYRLAGWLSIGLLTPSIFLAACDPSAFDPFYLYFLVLPLMLSSVFSVKATIGLAIGDLIGMVAVPLIVYGPTILPQLTGPISFFLIMSSASHFFTSYHSHLEYDRRRELAQERNLLRTLIDNLPDYIYFKNQHSQFILANKATAQFMGAEMPEQMLGKTDFDFYPHDFASRYYADEQHILSSGQPLLSHEEEVIDQATQQTRWLLSSKLPLRDAEGNISGLVGIGRDITAHKQNEIALRASEQFLQSTLDALSAHIAIVDKTGTVIAVNEAWRRFGQENSLKCADSCIGSNYLHVCDATSGAGSDDAQATAQGIRKVIAGHQDTFQLEYACHSPQQKRWFHVCVTRFDNDQAVYAVIAHENITERKQAELALRESERTLFTLMSNLPGMAYRCRNTPDWTMTFVSEGSLALTGYSPQNLIENRDVAYAQIIHPEDHDFVFEEVQQALEKQRPFQIIYRIITSEDQQKWVWEQGRGIYTEQGDIPYIEGFVLDISYRIKQEQMLRESIAALNESEQTYRALFENANDAIFLLDLEGNHVNVNLKAAAMLGYTRGELIGMSAMEIIAPEEHAAADAKLQALLAGKTFPLYERHFRKKDGTPLPVEINVSLVRDTEGQPKFIQSIVRDISARKRAEHEIHLYREHLEEVVEERTRQLQASEARYRAVVEDQTEMICRFKADGTLTFVNAAYCRYFAKTREELVGNTFFDLAPEEEWAGMQAHLASFSLEQPVKTYEHQVIGPDGEMRWQQWTDRAIFDETGIIVEYQSVGRDITQRVKMEQALRESKDHLSQMNVELARAARLKDEFLANMSHELRTPLNSILGMAETLEEGIIGDLNERQTRAVHTILSSGSHLLALINDILDVSKIEAGKLTLQIRSISVKIICQGSLNIIQEAARKKQQQIITKFDPAVATIQADPRRLKQILVNLLSNASKFTPEGGTIGLDVIGDAEKQMVQFVIWDAGIGIKSEDIPRLFTPFVQLDSSLARQHTGTGLGLSLVYRLTEMHGGSVRVESEVGRGSRFIISLPWQPETASQKIQPPTPTEKEFVQITKSTTILLVEDNPDNIKTISKYLHAKGYTLIIARTGHQALERLQEETPHLILMDIQMPEMDGFEAIRRIRALPDYQAIPIIATTALAMPGDRERCLAAGANDYVSKPITLKNLTLKIEHLLKKTSETEASS